MVSINS